MASVSHIGHVCVCCSCVCVCVEYGEGAFAHIYKCTGYNNARTSCICLVPPIEYSTDERAHTTHTQTASISVTQNTEPKNK